MSGSMYQELYDWSVCHLFFIHSSVPTSDFGDWPLTTLALLPLPQRALIFISPPRRLMPVIIIERLACVLFGGD